MKTKAQADYTKIIDYRKKNGGTVSAAAVATGASLHNYSYWRHKLKSRPKARHANAKKPPIVLVPKSGKAVLILGTPDQIREIVGGLA